jgi:hypothetical protein
MFIFMKHDEGKISESILELSNAFNWHQRHSLQPWVKMMTMRKYFGSHFHSIVSYLPVIYRIFDTNTILTNSLDDFVGDFNMNVVGLQILCKISFRCSTSLALFRLWFPLILL